MKAVNRKISTAFGVPRKESNHRDFWTVCGRIVPKNIPDIAFLKILLVSRDWLLRGVVIETPVYICADHFAS